MNKIYGIFVENLHYKLLALIFSILLWFLATNKEISEVILIVKYVPVSTGNYKVVDFEPKKLKLKIEGYRKELIQLNDMKTPIKIYLPQDIPVENGWVSLELRKSQIKLPAETVKVKEIKPDKIKIKIEKLIKKAVPIRPNVLGLKKGIKIEIIPNYAVVLLPEELLNTKLTVQTEKVDVTNVQLPAYLVVKLKSKYRVEPNKVEVILKNGGKK